MIAPNLGQLVGRAVDWVKKNDARAVAFERQLDALPSPIPRALGRAALSLPGLWALGTGLYRWLHTGSEPDKSLWALCAFIGAVLLYGALRWIGGARGAAWGIALLLPSLGIFLGIALWVAVAGLLGLHLLGVASSDDLNDWRPYVGMFTIGCLFYLPSERALRRLTVTVPG